MAFSWLTGFMRWRKKFKKVWSTFYDPTIKVPCFLMLNKIEHHILVKIHPCFFKVQTPLQELSLWWWHSMLAVELSIQHPTSSQESTQNKHFTCQFRLCCLAALMNAMARSPCSQELRISFLNNQSINQKNDPSFKSCSSAMAKSSTKTLVKNVSQSKEWCNLQL